MTLSIKCNICTRDFEIKESQRSDAKIRCPFCTAMQTNVHIIKPIAKAVSEAKSSKQPDAFPSKAAAPPIADLDIDEILPELPQDLATLDLDALDDEPEWLKSENDNDAVQESAKTDDVAPPSQAVQRSFSISEAVDAISDDELAEEFLSGLDDVDADDVDAKDEEDDDDITAYDYQVPASLRAERSQQIPKNKDLERNELDPSTQSIDHSGESDFSPPKRSKLPIFVSLLLALLLIAIVALASQNHGIFHFGKVSEMFDIATKSAPPMRLASEVPAPAPQPILPELQDIKPSYDVAISAPSRVALASGQSYVFIQANLTATSDRRCKAPQFQLSLRNRLGIDEAKSPPTLPLATSDQAQFASPDIVRAHVATLDQAQFDAWRQQLQNSAQTLVAERGTQALSVLFFLDSISKDEVLGRNFFAVVALDCQSP